MKPWLLSFLCVFLFTSYLIMAWALTESGVWALLLLLFLSQPALSLLLLGVNIALVILLRAYVFGGARIFSKKDAAK